MNRAFKAALAGALATALAAPVLAAQTIQVDFDLDNSLPNSGAFAGSFVATDTNGDGIISIDEVSSFRIGGLGQATLLAFGDFDIADDRWTTDDSAAPGDYYVLSDGPNLYIDGIRPETTISVLVVPEPSNVLLMGLGLGALAVALRRHRGKPQHAPASLAR